MNRRRLLRLSFLRVVLVALLWSAYALAHAQTAATVTEIAGMVVETDAAGRSRVLAMDSSVASGSVLRTATDSHVRLKFGDGTTLLLRPNTEFSIGGFRFEQARPDTDNFAVRLIKGGFRQVTGLIGKRNPHVMDIRAATATIGIRGTDFAVRMCDADCDADTEARQDDTRKQQADARRQQDEARKQQEDDARRQQEDARKQQADAAKQQDDARRRQEDDAKRQQDDARKRQADAAKQQDAMRDAGVYVQVHDGSVSLAQAGTEIVLIKGEVGFADAKNSPPQRIDSPPPVLRQDRLLGRPALGIQGCAQ